MEDNERDIFDPSIQGTKSILQAVEKYSPQVKRIVITFSFTAIADPTQGLRPGYTCSEQDWNTVTYEQAKSADAFTAYCASKTIAEKAAWDLVKEGTPNFHVAIICPPMVYGPIGHDASLDHLNSSSADIYRLMNGSQKKPEPTAVPAFADVRDVAEAHLKAYEAPKGSRYFIATGNFQYPEVCEIIKKALPAYASKVPDPSSTEQVETYKVNNEHARKDLGMHFTPLDQTISDAAKSLARLEEEKH